MNKKFKYILAVVALSVSLCSCGNRGSDAMQVINPIQEMTKEDLVEKTGIFLDVPGAAEDAMYSVIEAGDKRSCKQVIKNTF